MLTDDQSASARRLDPSILGSLGRALIAVQRVVVSSQRKYFHIWWWVWSLVTVLWAPFFWVYPLPWKNTFASRAFPSLNHSPQTSVPGWQHFECFKVEGLPAVTSCWLIANNSSHQLLSTCCDTRHYAKHFRDINSYIHITPTFKDREAETQK